MCILPAGKQFLKAELKSGFIGGLIQEPRLIHNHPRDTKYYSSKTYKEGGNPREIVEKFGVHNGKEYTKVSEIALSNGVGENIFQ